MDHVHSRESMASSPLLDLCVCVCHGGGGVPIKEGDAAAATSSAMASSLRPDRNGWYKGLPTATGAAATRDGPEKRDRGSRATSSERAVVGALGDNETEATVQTEDAVAPAPALATVLLLLLPMRGAGGGMPHPPPPGGRVEASW